MLCLTRKKGQKIVVNNGDIVIHIMRCENGRVRIGIEADNSVLIDREEVYLKKQLHKAVV